LKRLILIALALGLATMLVACSGSSSASGLTGKTWHLTAITEKVPAFQGVIPAADQSRYAITFNTDGTFNATADCNQVSGSYKTSGSNGLTITPGPSTMAFCGEASFGTQYVEGLSKAASYTVSGNDLTITLSDGGTMTFVAA
jgi:heat shock protein HslJ